jgi:hypothetical protein
VPAKGKDKDKEGFSMGKLLGGVNISGVKSVSVAVPASAPAPAGAASASASASAGHLPTSLRSLKAKLARSMSKLGGAKASDARGGAPLALDVELLCETIGEIRTLWRLKEQAAGTGSSQTFWQHFSSLSATEEASRLLQWLVGEVRVLQLLQRPAASEGLAGALSLFAGQAGVTAGATPYHRYRDPWEVRVRVWGCACGCVSVDGCVSACVPVWGSLCAATFSI